METWYISTDDVTGLSTLWDEEAVEQQRLYLSDIYFSIQHINATHGEVTQSESICTIQVENAAFKWTSNPSSARSCYTAWYN